MNLSSLQSCFSNTQNSIQSFILRCCGLCVRKRQVHPEVFILRDSEFVNLGSQRIIRVLHFPAQRKDSSNQDSFITPNGEKRKSLEVPIEEYWFTRSNRPFKLGDDCECVSDQISSQKRISKVWEDVTIVYEKNVTPISNTYTGSVERGSDYVYGRFAENVVRMVLDEVYGRTLSQEKSICSKVKSKNFYPDNSLYLIRKRANNSFCSIDSDYLLHEVESIAQVHREEVDIVRNKQTSDRDEFYLKNDISLLTRSSRDGIVNISFSGTSQEPDNLSNRALNEEQFLQFDSSQNTFELSDGSNARSYVSLNESLVSSKSKKYFENSKKLTSNGMMKAGKLQHCNGERLNAELRNDSLLAEDYSALMNRKVVQQLKRARENIVNSDICQHDCVDKITERNADLDRCWNTKISKKPFLLFLHGAGSSADVWSLQLQYFSTAGYEVIAPDMLGHGYSSSPDNPSAYTFQRLLEDVLKIFDRFILEHRKCVIIGHSYGSCFAAAVTRHRPQQVAQLVLLSSGGPSPLVPSGAFFHFPPCIMSLMKPFLMCGFKRDLFYGPRGKHLHPCCTYELPPNVLKYVERGQKWAEGDAAFHRRITVPTLLVHGLKDPFISLVEECEMERTIPRSFLEVISNAGHMLMLDTPEQLCHMIHSFITWWDS